MKRKTLSAFLGLIVFVSTTYAQDIITKINGDEVKVKITEVSSDEVKYKKYTNLSGPSYVILSSEIFMIKYENEDKDLFEKSPQTGKIVIRNIVTEKPAPNQEQKSTSVQSLSKSKNKVDTIVIRGPQKTYK